MSYNKVFRIVFSETNVHLHFSQLISKNGEKLNLDDSYRSRMPHLITRELENVLFYNRAKCFWLLSDKHLRSKVY